MLPVEYATLSLAGGRQENQDRVEVFAGGEAVLIAVVDGMGGHSGGAKAAECTIAVLGECFADVGKPVFDPQGFLTLALARAHDAVVALGAEMALDHKPRATCAVCLVQDAGAYWAHVGDSRIYQLRDGVVLARTRDHSHVELLLHEGQILESEMKAHPMRNFVECCLGGEPPLPDMSITALRRFAPRDLLLVCTDGLWSGLEDEELALLNTDPSLESALRNLGERAVGRNSPYSDNTSAAVLRWLDGRR